MDLAAKFSEFAGTEVHVAERPSRSRRGAEPVVTLEENDPVAATLRQIAAERGFRVRFLMPGHAATLDIRGDRVNVRIEKDPADGKYRIGPNFTFC